MVVTVHQISADVYPFEIFIQFTSGALSYAGVSLCATSYYLPQAYNASAYGTLVLFFFFFSITTLLA